MNNSLLKDKRILQARDWLNTTLLASNVQFSLLASDASFRRYFRLQGLDKSYILMDAPPEKESCEPFVAIAQTLRSLGLDAPEVFAADIKKGFLLLSDFGDRLYLDVLNIQNATQLYQKAFVALLIMQKCKNLPNYSLPKFTSTLYYTEMNLFRDWYLPQKGLILSAKEQLALDKIFQVLVEDALSQPQVFVHRDFHSRNLMVLGNNQLGILDFQDAVWGPVTYDLMSLLRDCYIDWPLQTVEAWVFDFYQQAKADGLINVSAQRFLRWFDWMGLQRNLKCIGLFVRLNIRDKKSKYLQDISRVLMYAYNVCKRYPEFRVLQEILEKCNEKG